MRIDDPGNNHLNALLNNQPTRPSLDLRIGEDDSSSKEADFQDFFAESWQAFEEASAASKETTAQLMTGQLDDLSGHLVAGEQANILFELNLTMRNKVLDAYNEVMRMSI